MLVYVYDNSFEGLLTAVFEAYYRRENPDRILAEKGLQYCLVDRFLHIAADEVKSKKVYDSIRTKISGTALQNVYRAYLSDDGESGTYIYEYLRLGWKVGRDVDSMMADDRVLRIHNLCRKVGLEVHRMLGFVRFSVLEGGIYYAVIKPDHNIIELVAPHFEQRLMGQKWIIQDAGRNIAAICDGKEWGIAEGEMVTIPAADKDEELYRKLWRQFFNSIAIAGRYNPKLQKRLMPVRYWQYMTEKNFD